MLQLKCIWMVVSFLCVIVCCNFRLPVVDRSGLFVECMSLDEFLVGNLGEVRRMSYFSLSVPSFRLNYVLRSKLS